MEAWEIKLAIQNIITAKQLNMISEYEAMKQIYQYQCLGLTIK